MIFIAMGRKIESQNVRDKWHWSKRAKEKHLWEWEIACALRGEKRKHRHKENRRLVKITSLRPRLLDKGNLYGGAKGLVDALVDLELIKDDSEKWCELEMVQKKQSAIGTIIEIEDL